MMLGVSTGTSAPEAGKLLQAIDESDAALLARFCLTDRWTASLHNAMLHLGPQTCAFHGLDPSIGRFGLLEFVRCYEPGASRKIIGLFEDAAARACPFHYSAEIDGGAGGKRLVHCFAEFEDGEEGGQLNGLFLLPRHGVAQTRASTRI